MESSYIILSGKIPKQQIWISVETHFKKDRLKHVRYLKYFLIGFNEDHVQIWGEKLPMDLLL